MEASSRRDFEVVSELRTERSSWACPLLSVGFDGVVSPYKGKTASLFAVLTEVQM